MAETAAILSPEKIILLPEVNAGCPMAVMATVEKVRNKIKELPNAVVISYVNSSVAVKSLSDYCFTSANSVQVAKTIPVGKDILFLPDMNLADFTAKGSKRKIIPWPDFCSVYHLRKNPLLSKKFRTTNNHTREYKKKSLKALNRMLTISE